MTECRNLRAYLAYNGLATSFCARALTCFLKFNLYDVDFEYGTHLRQFSGCVRDNEGNSMSSWTSERVCASSGFPWHEKSGFPPGPPCEITCHDVTPLRVDQAKGNPVGSQRAGSCMSEKCQLSCSGPDFKSSLRRSQRHRQGAGGTPVGPALACLSVTQDWA